MTIKGELQGLVKEFRIMNLYEQFERVVLLLVSGIIVTIAILAFWSLLLQVLTIMLSSNFLAPQKHADFQEVFGAIFTVIIALEFKRSILVAAEGHETVFQVRIVILIALLAILRKFIILDIEVVGALKVLALSGAVVALGAVYWLIRDQDLKMKDARIIDNTGSPETRTMSGS